MNFNIDIDEVILDAYKTGTEKKSGKESSLPDGLSWEKTIGPMDLLKLEVELADLDIHPNLTARRTVSYEPAVSVRYQFDPAVYIDGELTSGITVDAGSDLQGSVCFEGAYDSSSDEPTPVRITPTFVVGGELSGSTEVAAILSTPAMVASARLSAGDIEVWPRRRVPILPYCYPCGAWWCAGLCEWCCDTVDFTIDEFTIPGFTFAEIPPLWEDDLTEGVEYVLHEEPGSAVLQDWIEPPMDFEVTPGNFAAFALTLTVGGRRTDAGARVLYVKPGEEISATIRVIDALRSLEARIQLDESVDLGAWEDLAPGAERSISFVIPEKQPDGFLVTQIETVDSNGKVDVIDSSGSQLVVVDGSRPSPPLCLYPDRLYTNSPSETLSWSRAEDNSGGSGVDLYRIAYLSLSEWELSGAPEDFWLTAHEFETEALRVSLSRLVPAESGGIIWRVRARDRAGYWSLWSTTQTLVLDTTPPGVPDWSSSLATGTVASSTEEEPYQLMLAWDPASDDSGIAGYEVRIDYDNGTSEVRRPTQSPLVLDDKPLTYEGDLEWKVRAIDLAGNVGEYDRSVSVLRKYEVPRSIAEEYGPKLTSPAFGETAGWLTRLRWTRGHVQEVKVDHCSSLFAEPTGTYFAPDFYQVEIVGDNGYHSVRYTPQTWTGIPDDIPDGDYIWQVTATSSGHYRIEGSGCTSYSTLRLSSDFGSFSIRDHARPMEEFDVTADPRWGDVILSWVPPADGRGLSYVFIYAADNPLLRGARAIGQAADKFVDETVPAGQTRWYQLVDWTTRGPGDAVSDWVSVVRPPRIPGVNVFYSSQRKAITMVLWGLEREEFQVYRASSEGGVYRPVSLCEVWGACYEECNFGLIDLKANERGKRYWYKVRASAGGMWSEFSEPLSAYLPLPAVQGATATTDLTDHIEIAWTPAADASSYTVVRRVGEDETSYALLSAPPFIDSDAQPGQTVEYEVLKCGEDDCCTGSGVVIGHRRLLPPIEVDATRGSVTRAVRVRWSEATGADEYAVERADAPGGVFEEIGMAPVPWYDDTTAVPETVYFYRVRAISDGYPSDPSASAEGRRGSELYLRALDGERLSEGETLSREATFNDTNPDSTTWRVVIDYGDGSPLDERVVDSKSIPLRHKYRNDDEFAVSIHVSNDLGLEDLSGFGVLVDNVAPTLPEHLPYSMHNRELTYTGRFQDPGADPWTATADYGEGDGPQTLELDGRSFELRHTYRRANRRFSVVVRVNDGVAVTSRTWHVYVPNATPAFSQKNVFLSVNGLGELSYAGSFDDDGEDGWTAQVDYNDGAGFQPLALDGRAFELAHTYGEVGSYSVRVTVVDAYRMSATQFVHVTVKNVTPTLQLKHPRTSEGDEVSWSCDVEDPDSTSWSVRVNYGDSDPWFDLPVPGSSVGFSHTYRTAGSYEVRTKVTDDAGATSDQLSRVTVLDVPPTVSELAGATLNEGDVYTETVHVSGFDGDTYRAEVHYGERWRWYEDVPIDEDGRIVLRHVYPRDGTYQVACRVYDDDGSVDSQDCSVEVKNVPPVVSLPAEMRALAGSSFVLEGSYADPGDETSMGITVRYWDRNRRQFIYPNGRVNMAEKTFAIPFTLAAEGNYAVEVWIDDRDGGRGKAVCQVEVIPASPPMPETWYTQPVPGILSNHKGILLSICGALDAVHPSIEGFRFTLRSPETTVVFDRDADWRIERFPVPEDGTWTVEVVVHDRYGRVSEPKTFGPFIIDTTKPEVEISSAKAVWNSWPIVFDLRFNEVVTLPESGTRYTDPYDSTDNFYIKSVNQISDTEVRIEGWPLDFFGSVFLRLRPVFRDLAGNPIVEPEEATVAFDMSGPWPPLVTSSTHTVGVLSNVDRMAFNVSSKAHSSYPRSGDAVGFRAFLSRVEDDAFGDIDFVPADGEGGLTLEFPIPEDGEWWLHAQAIDWADNVGRVNHFGPLLVDRTAPRASLSSSRAEWSSSPILVNLRGNEPLADLADDDVILEGGHLHSIRRSMGMYRDREFEIRVIPGIDGDVTVSIADGAIRDSAGNTTRVVPLVVSFNDVEPPTVPAIRSSSHTASVLSLSRRIQTELEASTDTVSGINGYWLALTQSELSEPTGTTHGPSFSTGTFEAPADGEWWMHAAAQDGAGNWSEAIALGPFMIDATAPSAMVSADGSETDSTPIFFRAVFSEPVHGFTRSDVVVVNGRVQTISALTTAEFTIPVEPAEEGDVTLRIPAGVAEDVAGNGNTESSTAAVLYNVLPELIEELISTSNPSGEYCTVGDTVTVSFTASEKLGRLPEVEIGGCTASVDDEGSNEYRATCELDDETDQGPIEYEITIEDEQGNAVSVEDDTGMFFDSEPPTFEDCPDDIETPNIVWWREPTAEDDLSGLASLTSTHGPDDSFDAGTTTTITYTAIDEAGNSAVCEFDVTVTDDPVTVTDFDVESVEDGVIVLVVEFSEDVYGVDRPDSECCLFWGGDTSEFEVEVSGTAWEDSADPSYCVEIRKQMSIYTISICGLTESGEVEVTIPAGVVEDADGNPNEESNTVEIEYVHP